LGVALCVDCGGATEPVGPPLTLQGRTYTLVGAGYVEYQAPIEPLPAAICLVGSDSVRVTAGSLTFGTDSAIEIESLDTWKNGTRTRIQDSRTHPYIALSNGTFRFSTFLGDWMNTILDTASTSMTIEHNHGTAIGCGGVNTRFVFNRTH